MFYLHLTLQERNVTYHLVGNLVGGLCKVSHMEEVLNNGFLDFNQRRHLTAQNSSDMSCKTIHNGSTYE